MTASMLNTSTLQYAQTTSAPAQAWLGCPLPGGDECDHVDDVNILSHRSFALHELKRTAEAEVLLLPALERFTDEPTIPYNLACYACVLSRVEEARRLLERAIEV
jgi:hypothetical protein